MGKQKTQDSLNRRLYNVDGDNDLDDQQFGGVRHWSQPDAPVFDDHRRKHFKVKI